MERHPEPVRVRTFPKLKEAKSGADEEWHTIGRRRTVKMRVQAKRLQRGRYFRMLSVRYFEGLNAERAISCQRLDLPLYGLPRRRPRYNGCVVRGGNSSPAASSGILRRGVEYGRHQAGTSGASALLPPSTPPSNSWPPDASGFSCRPTLRCLAVSHFSGPTLVLEDGLVDESSI